MLVLDLCSKAKRVKKSVHDCGHFFIDQNNIKKYNVANFLGIKITTCSANKSS